MFRLSGIQDLKGSHGYDWRLTLNEPGIGWRGRLACWLRQRAHQLDGQWSLSVAFTSQPSLTMAQQREVILGGFNAMEAATKALVHTEVIERAMRAQRPELFKDNA